MGRRLAAIVLAIAGLAVVIYAAVVGWAAAHQSDYFFDRTAQPSRSIPTRAPGFSRVVLATPDGEKIIGWWIPPEAGKGVVLYLHGNSGNVGERWRRLGETASAGFGLLAIDYRGYAGSSGRPTERGVYTDARTAWDFIRTQAPDRPVVIWGESLGTAVASKLATDVNEAGVILDSPFTSMVDMVRVRARWFPYPFVSQKFDTLSRIDRIGSPLVVVHCRPDATVPFAFGERVFAEAKAPKTFIPLEGCRHIRIWREPAKTQILQFLDARLSAPAPRKPQA